MLELRAQLQRSEADISAATTALAQLEADKTANIEALKADHHLKEQDLHSQLKISQNMLSEVQHVHEMCCCM